eukprot:4404155-Prymnesium_polylepis.1
MQTRFPSTTEVLKREYGIEPAASSSGHKMGGSPVPTKIRCAAHLRHRWRSLFSRVGSLVETVHYAPRPRVST